MTIKGFDSDRYNEHDQIIIDIVNDINANKETVYGVTKEQATGIPDLDPRLVKAWMIQETGGRAKDSKDAWEIDPLQIKVPGDCGRWKSKLGIGSSAPASENTGELKKNIRAGIIWMVRKGFGFSGQPPKNRVAATFDGLSTALNRYGPKKKRPFYGEQIIKRFTNRKEIVHIEKK